jgi:hypothetical protein
VKEIMERRGWKLVGSIAGLGFVKGPWRTHVTAFGWEAEFNGFAVRNGFATALDAADWIETPTPPTRSIMQQVVPPKQCADYHITRLDARDHSGALVIDKTVRELLIELVNLQVQAARDVHQDHPDKNHLYQAAAQLGYMQSGTVHLAQLVARALGDPQFASELRLLGEDAKAATMAVYNDNKFDS